MIVNFNFLKRKNLVIAKAPDNNFSVSFQAIELLLCIKISPECALVTFF